MKNPSAISVLLFSLPLLALGACSGSSSSSSELSADNIEGVSDTFNALEGLLFDEEGSSRLSPRSQEIQEEDRFSYMGCHYKQDRERMFRDVRQVRVPLCYISNMEKNLDKFSIKEGDYSYFRITGSPDGESGPNKDENDFFRIRIGKFKDKDGNRILRYQMCDGETQSEDFEVANINGGIQAKTAHIYTHEFDGEVFSGSGRFLVKAIGEKSDQIDSAIIESVHDDNWGSGSAYFTADRSKKKNTFQASFTHNWADQMTGKTYAGESCVNVVAGGGLGSGIVSGTNQFPAYDDGGTYYCPPKPGEEFDESGNYVGPQISLVDTCEQEFTHRESFRFSGTSADRACYVIPEENSPWADDVADECPIEINEDTFAFEVEWDCSAPDGFVEIDFSADSLTEVLQECVDLEKNDSSIELRSCEAQRNEELDQNNTL